MSLLESMTREERSLLLYLETAVVDYGGRYKGQCINDGDREIMDRWADDGFITHGRICAADHNRDGALWVQLSPEWLELAHCERKARAKRTWEARRYRTTEEHRNAPVES